MTFNTNFSTIHQTFLIALNFELLCFYCLFLLLFVCLLVCLCNYHVIIACVSPIFVSIYLPLFMLLWFSILCRNFTAISYFLRNWYLCISLSAIHLFCFLVYPFTFLYMYNYVHISTLCFSNNMECMFVLLFSLLVCMLIMISPMLHFIYVSSYIYMHLFICLYVDICTIYTYYIYSSISL